MDCEFWGLGEEGFIIIGIMHIEEIESEGLRVEEKATVEEEDEGNSSPSDKLIKAADDGVTTIVLWDARKVFVGVGARALFYPTLLYNVVRNKIQAEFRWWDWIDEVSFAIDHLRIHMTFFFLICFGLSSIINIMIV